MKVINVIIMSRIMRIITTVQILKMVNSRIMMTMKFHQRILINNESFRVKAGLIKRSGTLNSLGS